MACSDATVRLKLNSYFLAFKKATERLHTISHSDILGLVLFYSGSSIILLYLCTPARKLAAPLWNCDASPPGDLIKSLHLERTAINEDELSRAEWFWNRRPRLLCGNLIFCFCYLVVFVCLVYLFPESAPSTSRMTSGSN